jgi:hypothetical protein
MDDEDKGMRRSGRQKDERAAVESAASKRAARQVHLRSSMLSCHWWQSMLPTQLNARSLQSPKPYLTEGDSFE